MGHETPLAHVTETAKKKKKRAVQQVPMPPPSQSPPSNPLPKIETFGIFPLRFWGVFRHLAKLQGPIFPFRHTLPTSPCPNHCMPRAQRLSLNSLMPTVSVNSSHSPHSLMAINSPTTTTRSISASARKPHLRNLGRLCAVPCH